MKTTLEPQALMESLKGKTLLLQASIKDSHVNVPTQIDWKDVKLPNKWLLRNVNKEYYFTIVALLDLGADSNCIQEELIPAKYYERTTEGLSQASGTSLSIEFELPNAYVHKDGIYIQTTFVLVKNITNKVILGNPFITLLYPIREISEKGLTTQIYL